MSSQRFCLRWNNHQTNLLSVFDQLLHAETFTDVTLAVEGQYLKAHKMVLSACSPYFQALFINHPEKHPIVILKDVPYADMKSLLDFMYRGEVSVDQERLTAFLRVAESLRIKGLTEVNDEKPQGQALTPPPPQLHRINPYLVQQRKTQQGMLVNNPLLGSALTGPKRKRGRPRKLSGSSNGTGQDYDDDYDESDNLIQGSPEMLEVKMGTDGFTNSGNETSDEMNRNSNNNDDSNQDCMDTSETLVNKTSTNPAASASKEPSPRKDQDNSTSDEIKIVGLLVPKQEQVDTRPGMTSFKIRVNPLTQTTGISNISNALQNETANSNNTSQVSTSGVEVLTTATTTTNTLQPVNITKLMNTNILKLTSSGVTTPSTSTTVTTAAGTKATLIATIVATTATTTSAVTVTTSKTSTSTTPTTTTTNTPAKQPVRRRVRRKAATVPGEEAEHLTEMSVRGLNLFRYASIIDGVYQCIECAKENIQKTFKNKYSFQRHAFLYHEGTQRKVFPCPVCLKEFSRPDKMKNHMKTTHECYMPKDCVYPLNFLMGSGGDMPQICKVENATSQ